MTRARTLSVLIGSLIEGDLMRTATSFSGPSGVLARARTAGRVLIAVCILAVSTSARGQATGDAATTKLGAAPGQHDLESKMKAAAEAVVRIKTPTEYASSGVVVSETGHVIWPGGSPPLPDLFVALPSGESVPADNLGWSVEWQVGVLKLRGDRKWPHVDFGSTAHSKPGDRCFEVGYHARKGQPVKFDRLPDVRKAQLTLVSPSHWFATDLKPSDFEYGTGTFDAEGKLLGISVPGVSVHHALSTAVDVVKANWEPLADGKNLDWVRYPPSKDSLFLRLAEPGKLEWAGFLPRKEVPGWKDVTAPATINEGDFASARKVAAATTVRIRLRSRANPPEPQKSSCWSGVVIGPQGHIATCAHTKQLAGEELVVVLPDSREVPAVALGTNWVSDVGLVKINAPGPWAFAELGDSSMIAPDGAVLCAGFPAPDVRPLPPVATAVYPLQQAPYVGWGPELMYRIDYGDTLAGGSSGGGIFDRNGKLVATFLGPGGGHRIEMLRAEMEYLKGERAVIGR